MELDLFRPGYLVHTDINSLQTSDGQSSTTIAGDPSKYGYREGRGSEARFRETIGFVQISNKRVVVADRYNHCLRGINRRTDNTSMFSGLCEKPGYSDGLRGQFNRPWSVIRDNHDASQLFVSDYGNKAVRTVDISTGAVGTVVMSDILEGISCLTQDNSGDLYGIAASQAIYRITYKEKTIQLISGIPNKSGDSDGSLLNSLFNDPFDLLIIGHQTLLVTDTDSNKIRLVDITGDKVSTLNLCSWCLFRPFSLLITEDSLYVSQYQRIKQFVCE